MSRSIHIYYRQCFAWKLPRACSVDKIRSLLFPFS
uniref:Uncharacterized protein n=1 Tax=Vitis vinifera TaxID=29760 RepID=F6HYM7_VITVI